MTLRETLKTVERMTGKMPKEGINPVTFPQILNNLWLWFLDLNSSRSSGFGMSQITYQDMYAYFSLMGHWPDPWEIEILKRIDKTFIESAKDK